MTKSTAFDFTALLARLLLGVIFIRFGIGKVADPYQTIQSFNGLGLPVPTLAYAVTILIEMVIGWCFLIGLAFRGSSVVLAGWCIATAVAGHGDFHDKNAVIHFYKNVSMCGGFLYAALAGPGRISIDNFLVARRLRAA
jgi:putative oxidoreductase